MIDPDDLDGPGERPDLTEAARRAQNALRAITHRAHSPNTRAPNAWGWQMAARPEHPDCDTCRQAPGGPDHGEESTA